MLPKRYLIAAGIIRRGDAILLARQQGPQAPTDSWALPGGVVEDGELITEALAREVREETDLEIMRVGPLAYTAHIDHAVGGVQSVAFIFEIAEWCGTLNPVDPDHLILELRFFPLAEAIPRLEALPWRYMREPLITYLRGETSAGTVWVYRDQPEPRQPGARAITPETASP